MRIPNPLPRSLLSKFFVCAAILCLSFAPPCVGEGFLADEIPLEVDASTPSTLLEGGTIDVRRQQTITVVFSRPVIALGADFGEERLPTDLTPFSFQPSIPGLSRWVTTYIYRFDVQGAWPRDLHADLKWNRELTTYDGVRFKPPENPVHIRTQFNHMSISTIVSRRANELTDNNWSPTSGLKDDILPECPPDGVIQLRFDVPVLLSVLRRNLRVRKLVKGEIVSESDAENRRLRARVMACDEQKNSRSSTCANVTFGGALHPNTKYELFVMKGVRYHPKHGRLKQKMSATFGGLRPFKIPFLEWEQSFRTQYLDIWLPHGLDDQSTIHDIPITITEINRSRTAPFKREKISKSIFRLIVDWKDDRKYRVQTTSSDQVRDGYGQPLIATRMNASTMKIDRNFELIHRPPLAIFEKGQDWGSRVALFTKGVRDKERCNWLYMWRLERRKLTIATIYDHEWRGTSLWNILGEPSRTVRASYKDPIGTVNTYRVRDLLQSTSMIAVQRCQVKFVRSFHPVSNYCLYRYPLMTPLFLAESDIMVSIVSVAQKSPERTAHVFVTNMVTGEPVPNALIRFYADIPKTEYEITFLGRGITDADGFTKIQVKSVVKIAAVIEYKRRLTFLKGLSVYSVDPDRHYSKLVLDRKLLRPNETLYVKGYVMQSAGSTFVIPESSYHLIVYPPFDSTEGIRYEPGSTSSYGSFEAEIQIPEDALPRTYSITLYREDHRSVGTEFVVGEPRPPTVTLEVEASKWTRPDGNATVTVTASSFVGASVGNQDIKIQYSYPGGNETIKGETTVITNNNGEAQCILVLSQTPGNVGHSVDFKIQWVGPTGELVEESASTRIVYADLTINVERTVGTIIPLQRFEARVILTDVNGGSLEDPMPEGGFVSIALMDDPKEPYSTLAEERLKTKVWQSCMERDDFEEYCHLHLPSMGIFVLEACYGQDNDIIVCQRESVGQSEDDWKENLFREFVPIGIRAEEDKEHTSNHHVLNVMIENPYVDAYAMISWGNVENVYHSVLRLPDDQRSVIPFILDPVCKLGCSFSMVIAVPRQTVGLATNLTVPIKKLHDPALPHTVHWDHSLRLDSDDDIDIQFDFPRVKGAEVVIPPGTHSQVKVTLDTKKPTEVTVMMVDKSILDLVYNPLTTLSDSFQIDLSVNFGHDSTDRYIISPEAIRVLIENFYQKKSLNPWFTVESQLKERYFWRSDIDKSKEEYIDSITSYLTTRPGWRIRRRYESTYFRTPGAAASEGSGRFPLSGRFPPPGPASIDVVGKLRKESNFEANILFHTGVVEGGHSVFNFTTSDNLGTIVVRAYAASGKGIFGNAETEFMVRRDVSLTASIPRFVRVDDVFRAGAVVTVTGSPKTRILFKVEVKGPIKIVGRSRRIVRVGGDKQEEARFSFKALGIGKATLTFRAWDRHHNRDSVQVSIPIEGYQEAVVVGTSFVLDATREATASKEGLRLPAAIPGSGSIVFAAGVGQQPAVLNLIKRLLRVNPNFGCPYWYDFVLGVTAVPAIIDPYSPWDKPGQSKLMRRVLHSFGEAVEWLSVGDETLTRYLLGLIFRVRCPDDNRPEKLHPSIYTNAQGLWIMNELQAAFEHHSVAEVQASKGAIDQATRIWRSVLAEECVKYAQTLRSKYNITISVYTVVECRSGLGASWEPPSETDPVIVADLSMKRLSAAFDEMRPEQQAFYIVVLQKEEPSHPDVARAVSSWRSNYRITGRTAYIAAAPGLATPASNLAQSLILLVMTRTGIQDQLLPKLVGFVAAPVSDPHGFRPYAPYDMTVAMRALAVYDASQNNTQPDVELYVTTDPSTLLFYAAFDEDSPAVVTGEVAWDELGRNPGPLKFSAVGRGEVSLAVTLNFVPAELLPFPSYRGIFVQRFIRLEEEKGQSLSVVPQGSVVFVEVQFMTPDSLQETNVRVPLPAGLEALDPNIFGGDTCPVPFFGFFGSFYGFSCPQQETRPSVVSFTFSSVRAGTHTVSFRAVAVTPGSFTLPPARVFVTIQPEVMGLSSAGRFTVCKGIRCRPVFEKPSPDIKGCPEDCNGNGSCNLEEGTCRCFDGFFGDACGKTAETQKTIFVS